MISFELLWFCVTVVTFSNISCIYVSIYLFWLHWVFVAGHRFSLAVEVRGYCFWCSALLIAVASVVAD